MMIDELDLCVCTGDLPNDFEVETIIGKHFDDNNKVEWLVKWMACGLCETMCTTQQHPLSKCGACAKHNGVVNNRHHSQSTKAK